MSEDAYRQVKARLNLAVDDLGQRRLKNIADPMRVYSLQVGVAATAQLGTQAPPAAPGAAVTPPDKPSIAVLPFANISGDPQQDYFSDGMSEDIITELSKFRSLLVISRHSSFAFKGKPVTVQQFGQELGAQYVLEGSVRRAGTRVRIAAQLIDARTSTHIWAERLDRNIDDLFAMQDEVTERIVSTIADRLERTERERAAIKRPEVMRSYDYILRARAIISETPEASQQSRSLYEKALALEPASASALTGIAWSHIIDLSSRWHGATDQTIELAHKLARQALILDGTDYRVHLLLGFIMERQRQYGEALSHYQQAMALNSNDADGAAFMGDLLVSRGRFIEALDWLQRAIRLNPLHPAWYLYSLGEAFYGARQYDNALVPLRAAINRFPGFVTPRRHMAAVYAQLDHLKEARSEVTEILKLDPSVCVTLYRKRNRYENSEDLEHYLDGLRKAGLRE